LDKIIDEAIKDSGAESIRDMGNVMGQVKAKAAGRADMGAVSAKVKERLGAT
ncbi:MAG: GatB/YqeY domain-containing protein, partial [Woeseiaceae bacterium]|nr:GatB/YqeY domain-containing protein [Woeseiaceae bacterium]